jgi:flagellar FliL protein
VFKNKLLQLSVIILIALTLIAGVVVALYFTLPSLNDNPDSTDPNVKVKEKVEKVDTSKYTADELLEMTVKMEDITANLADGELVMLSLTFLLDSVEAKEEFEKLDFIPREIVLKALADMNPNDLVGSKGSDKLASTLMNKINPELTAGKLSKIYVTKLMQPN